MKKVSFVLAIVLVLSCVLSSCGSSYKAFKTDPEYVSVRAENPNHTVSGVDGVKKSVPKDVKSVVCFNPSAGLVFSELGLNNLVKGADKDTVAVVKTFKAIDLQQIATQKPDVVFITETYDTSALDKAEIPYFSIPEVMTFNDVKTLIKLVEKVLGRGGDSLTVEIDNESTLALQTTNSMANKYDAFIDMGKNGKQYKTTGVGTYVNEVLSICGCDNVFGGDGAEEGFIQVTEQDIIAADPEFIFTTNPNDYKTNPAFENVKAVKENKVYRITVNNLQNGSSKIADSINEIFQYVENAKNAPTKK